MAGETVTTASSIVIMAVSETMPIPIRVVLETIKIPTQVEVSEMIPTVTKVVLKTINPPMQMASETIVIPTAVGSETIAHPITMVPCGMIATAIAVAFAAHQKCSLHHPMRVPVLVVSETTKAVPASEVSFLQARQT